MPTGLLILRVGVGLLMFGHGTQKLFGWFGGSGPRGYRRMLGSLGFRPVGPWAVLHGLAEAGGGVLLVLGFLTPLASAAIIGVMLVAGLAVHRPNGLWNTNRGYELPLAFGIVAAAVAFTGGGAFSVDAVLEWPLRGWAWGLSAVGVGLLAGLVANYARRPAGWTAEASGPGRRAA
jgi:putative oxidoreductase